MCIEILQEAALHTYFLTLETSEFMKVLGYVMNIQKLTVLLYACNKCMETKIQKQYHL